MADDWFKLNMDIFGNRKIKYLRRLPNGDSIALFWIVLLAEARRCNSDGKIFLTESIPYTPDMLAEDFHFEKDTVELALETFEQLDMTYTDNGFITITGWEDHQNAEGLARIREQTRKRVAKHRESKKLLPCNDESNATVTQCNATEEEKEIDKEKDKDIEEYIAPPDSDESEQPAPPKPTQKKSVKHKHGDFQNVLLSDPEFEKLADDFGADLRDKAISFLDAYIEEKGYKSKSHNLAIRRWVIDAVKENETKPKRYSRKEPVPGWCKTELSDAEAEDIKRFMNETATVGNDPELADRAEKLKQRLGG